MSINSILNHIIKILLVSLLCIMLLIGCIFVIPPVYCFADNYNIASYQVPYLADYGTSNFSSGLDINGTWYCATSTTDSAIIFATATSYQNNDKYYLVFFQRVEDFNPSTNTPYTVTVSNGSNSNNYFQSYSTVDEDWKYSVRYNSSNTIQIDPTTTSLPVFSSLSDAVSTLNQLDFSGGGGSSEPVQALVTVEPGYVAYIGITGGNAIFTATFNKKQPKGSIFTNIRMGFSSSRPSENSTITMDSSIGNAIPFVTDRPYDIWGKSFNGRYGIDELSPSYLIVYVPLSDPDGNTNATVKVACSEFLNVVQFPLSASMVGGEIISTGDSDVFYIADSELIGDDFRPTYIYSDDGSTSSAITLPAGGNNIPPTSSGGSLIEQFTSLLSDLINRIESLLIAPVEYIKWIISSSQNFMSWLSAVWTWLPAPVYDTIVAVLLILVVVGALKLLWR